MMTKEPFRESKKKKIFFRPYFYLGILFAFVFIVLGSMEYGRKLAIEHQFIPFRHVLENILEAKWEVITNAFKGLFSNPDQIYLDIKHRDFQKLAAIRKQALRSGKLGSTSEEVFVPAKIRHHDKTLPAKIRLKGDDVDHLANEKWSFRIQLKKDYALYGINTFSIQHPRTRNYIHEWLYHRVLAEEGVLTTRYYFVKVILNGKNLGIYVLEEHFQKHLIEHNQNLEGPILKFDESAYWNDYVYSAGTDHVSGIVDGGEAASAIDAFGMGSIQKNPVLYERFLVARNLLEAFRNRKLPAHQVFDIKKMATFVALSDLMSAPHALIWHNLRFYYNPISSLLEPIAFDGNAGKPSDKGILTGAYYQQLEGYRSFYEALFADPKFFETYLKEIERVAQPAFLDSFFSKIDGDLEQNLNILNKEFFYMHFSKKPLYQQQQKMTKALKPVKLLHSYFETASPQSVVLKMANIQSLPVEVLYVSHEDAKFYPAKRSLLFPKKNFADRNNFQRVFFSLPKGFVWSEDMAKKLVVYAKILGTSSMNAKMEAVFPWNQQDPELLKAAMLRKESTLSLFPFLHLNEADKKIGLPSGHWIIDKNLVIPQGYVFVAAAGAQIDLRRGAYILSYSPLIWEGTKESLIRLFSSDATGRGLVVLDAPKKSILKYVSFDNFKNTKGVGWELTGAVTFYRSPVDVLYSQFENLDAEDAINVKNTTCLIAHSIFSGANSDAIDWDFVEGQVVESSFRNIKGDAIDISGSRLTVKNVTIESVGDKGISAGEKSIVSIEGLRVRHAKICLASKDRSEVFLEDAVLSDCQMGIAVFQKKPEFGPASLIAKDVSIQRTKEPYLVEENSVCRINDQRIVPNRKKLAEVLY